MKKTDNILTKLISDIESASYQKIERKSQNTSFELCSDPDLLLNLSGNIGALIVRSLLKKLNIDEHRVLKWRLDNKNIQYQILNHYAPNCMAETIGLSQILNRKNGIDEIRKLCKQGYFLKAALGDGSGRAQTFDRTDELDEIINANEVVTGNLEKWILQKKLNIRKEFRIHTFGKDVIYGLTYRIQGENSLDNHEAEQFLKEVLDKLPDAILEGTLIGWDIAITTDNDFYVIEGNITGFHPELNRGFQTSGYFGDPYFGSLMSAILNQYFKTTYNISIGSIENSLLISDDFYKELIFYITIIKKEHLKAFGKQTNDTDSSAVIYLGDHHKTLLLKLMTYFKNINFIREYYLITHEYILTPDGTFDASY